MKLRIPNPLKGNTTTDQHAEMTPVDMMETDPGFQVTEGMAGDAYQADNGPPIVMTRGGSTPGRVGHKAHVEVGAYASPRRHEVNTIHELVPPTGDEPAIELRRTLEDGRHTRPRRPHRPDELADTWHAGTLQLGTVGTVAQVLGDSSAGTRYRTTLRLVAAATTRIMVSLAPNENEARGGIATGVLMLHDGGTLGGPPGPDSIVMEHSDAIWSNVVERVGGGPFYLTWWTEVVYDATSKPSSAKPES